MKKIYLLGLVLMLVITACSTLQNNTMQDDSMMENDAMKEDGAMEQEHDAMEDSMADDSMMEENDSVMESMEEEAMMENNESMMEDEMMQQDNMMIDYQGSILAGDTTPYIVFNKEDYEAALESNKVILLYFYANWCPICRDEQPKVFEAFNELDKENVVGFRVNYKDSATNNYEEQLAKEFGITYQHTKVILKDGERVLKAPDSWDKQRYLEEINKYA